MATSISNTGKTISFTFSEFEENLIKKVTGSSTVDIDYNWSEREVIISRGIRTISKFKSGVRYYFTEPATSKKYSHWPKFGRIEANPVVRGNTLVFKLPKDLPEPRQLNVKRKKKSVVKAEKFSTRSNTSKEEITVPQNQEPTANVLIVISGRTLEFAVPAEKLLDMTLEMAHSGYSVKGS